MKRKIKITEYQLSFIVNLINENRLEKREDVKYKNS